MNPVIARYLPEFPVDPVPAQVQAPAQAPRVPALPSPQGQASHAPGNPLGNPWAGLARAPRSPAPLPVMDVPDAIRIDPAQTANSPADPSESLADVWRDGLHALVAKPAVAKPAGATPAVAHPAAPAPSSPPEASAPVVSPFVKPPAQKRETTEERAALLAEAEERGRQLGLAEARREAETARLQASEEAQARLVEARRHWSAAEAEALADGFAAALRALDATLSDRIARLLVPVLTDALRRQAVAELSVALTRLLAEPQAATVRVSGPEDLLAALAGRLGPLSSAVSFIPAETPEVQVSADQTVIDTQLGAWTRLIAAAVAEI